MPDMTSGDRSVNGDFSRSTVVTGNGNTIVSGKGGRSQTVRLRRSWWSGFRFARFYRGYVLHEQQNIHLNGNLNTIGSYSPELDEVFVDVSLDQQAPHKIATGVLDSPSVKVTDRLQIEDLLDQPKATAWALLGPPGSGKTTLLQHTARQICRSRRNRRRNVPILLYLRDHAAEIVRNQQVELPELVREGLPIHDANPSLWLERKLKAGRCVVLLDGLDEVAQQSDRAVVVKWVQQQISRFHDNHFVITSRPHGYRTNLVSGATVLRVRSFTDKQVDRFVRGWYLAVELNGGTANKDSARQRAEAAAEDLLKHLRASPALLDLTVNPLLLTMIVNVHRERRELPSSRTELYHEICHVLLGRQEKKGITVELSVNRQIALLSELAFYMMDQDVRDLPRTALLAEIKTILSDTAQDIAETSALTLIEANGLIIEREEGFYSFVHQTFEEYLAAVHIQSQEPLSELGNKVDKQWWRETLLLYAECPDRSAGPTDQNSLVRACLDSGSVAALSLALACAEQSSTLLAPELQERLDGLLDSAFAVGTDSERRRLIASVFVTRQLHKQVRTDNGRICTRPTSARLYKLYMLDTQAPALDLATPKESNVDDPVLGVRGSDAVAFLRWINGIAPGQTAYRLPNQAEIAAPAVQQALSTSMPASPRSVWTAGDGGQDEPTLCTADGAYHPHTIDAATLGHHVREDINRSPHFLARLLLLRSFRSLRALDHTLVHARTLGHDLGHDLDHDLDRNRTLARTLASDRIHARTLARDLGNARNHARALDLTRDLVLALDLARDLVRDLDLDHTRNRVRDLDLDLDLDRNRALALARALGDARNLALALDHTLDLDRKLGDALDRNLGDARYLALALDHTLDHTLDHACALARALDRILAVDDFLAVDDSRTSDNRGDLHLVVGCALSEALTAALRKDAPDTAHRLVLFADAFVEKTRGTEATNVVFLDHLAENVHEGKALLQLIERSGTETLLPWANRVRKSLEANAIPIFTRQQRITADAATSVRLAALCLAVEADRCEDPRLSNVFREIAAAVTLLERRANGQAEPTETIILATD